MTNAATEVIDKAEQGVVDFDAIRRFVGDDCVCKNVVGNNNGDPAASRCRRYRRRILDISQTVPALHIGGAFSSVEIVDCIYKELMEDGDTFILSKGHAAILQYVVLESRGVLSPEDVAGYCRADGTLGVHPDRGVPGIVASTGSLGHGLAMALGMALADRKSTVYALLSDGELQEGSTWEAILMASSLKVGNLVAFVDNNNRQSLGRTSETHPSLYPMVEKFAAFEWDCIQVDGHDSAAIKGASKGWGSREQPLMIIAKTVKGKGVSFMEDVPMWHYRSPNSAEYRRAMRELES